MKLDEITFGDAQSIFEYLSDENESPDIFFARPRTIDDTFAWLHSMFTHGVQVFGVVTEDTHREVHGVITLKPTYDGKFQVGFYFKKSARGKGLFKFIDLACQFIDGTVVATPWNDNVKCHALLERIGFKHVASTATWRVYERNQT